MSTFEEKTAKLGAAIFVVIGFFASVVVLGLLFAFPIKWTWNATMPYLFALPTITWGKAWCLNFLCGMLVRSRLNCSKGDKKWQE